MFGNSRVGCLPVPVWLGDAGLLQFKGGRVFFVEAPVEMVGFLLIPLNSNPNMGTQKKTHPCPFVLPSDAIWLATRYETRKQHGEGFFVVSGIRWVFS